MNATLIWGGTGFIGRHLVTQHVEAGQAVTVLVRGDAADHAFLQHTLVHCIRVPASDPAAARVTMEAVREARVIYNLAGVSGAVHSNSNPLASEQGNCKIQAAFLEACAAAGNKPHVVFASSRLVYGAPRILPVNEDAPLDPRSFYAANKINAEYYHRIAALRETITYTICRISNPYGFHPAFTNQAYGFINHLIAQGARKAPLQVFGDGGQLRDYIHINDLTDALRLCGQHPGARNSIFNVGSGQSTSISEAACLIGQLTGSPVVYLPWPGEYALVETGDYRSDIRKLTEATGFQPRYGFEDGVRGLLGAAPSLLQEQVRQTAAGMRLADGAF